MSILCSQCGAPVRDGAINCEYCGAAIRQPVQQPTYQQPVQQHGYQQPGYQQPGYQQPVYQQPVYQQPIPVQPVYVAQPYNAERANWPVKSKMVAILLAFFLGGLGIHRFYLGDSGKGLLYLLFCWTFVPSILAFVDFIVMLCSSDENFMIKYRCRLG